MECLYEHCLTVKNVIGNGWYISPSQGSIFCFMCKLFGSSQSKDNLMKIMKEKLKESVQVDLKIQLS
jgi:hypothetical protein